ncbi:MAG: hypothetical protein ONB46_13505 [candidate division KSB1 bacterium]|nr:hypothetical protein [candidate division KSB1 bacterium]MDZ7367538.1 hypothetical protein [candidate division KSB1 bacterium]MDZ7404904.1 hypothetical protein [candidate division KSB1 bacterium]
MNVSRLSKRQIGFALFILIVSTMFLAWPVFAQETAVAPPLDVNPFLNMLALALVIERLIEIGVTFFPGLEEKKLSLRKTPDELAKLQLKISRVTMLIGMGLGVLSCVIFQFGVLDEIFPGKHLSLNFFNHLITGVIAGAGADPVHQLVLIIASVKQRISLRAELDYRQLKVADQTH